MDFRKLEAFCKVYELRSFSRAGQELFLSQPTISAHVADLEAELGTRLFDRLGRSILPTQAGDVLYTSSQDVFLDLERAVSEIHLLRDEVVGELAVGGSTIPSHYILPELMASFMDKYPEVSVRLTVGDTEAVQEAVLGGRLVFGVIGGRPEAAGLNLVRFMDDDLVAIAPPGRFKKARPAGLRDLADQPWVMRERGSGTRMALEQAFKSEGLQLARFRVRAWVASTAAVLECVRVGLGVSVTSRLAAAGPAGRGEVDRLEGLELPVRRSFFLLYRQGRTLSPAGEAFLRHLESSRPAQG
ncbi:MAG: selenium metabolism-associated LysR family transcriptional regulator [Desulfovibrionaceae bacterium]|nr:selenium metabolism-associated LysR family transcriptional regulator [Desulfovibrionaceae bacterium]